MKGGSEIFHSSIFFGFDTLKLCGSSSHSDMSHLNKASIMGKSMPPALPGYEVRWHYDVYLWEISDAGHGWIATDCVTEFGGSKDMTRLDEDFEIWVEVLNAYNDAHDIGEEYSDLSGFDWDSFNAAGLVLAKRLSGLLGPHRHIQYSKCILDKDRHALVWTSEEFA